MVQYNFHIQHYPYDELEYSECENKMQTAILEGYKRIKKSKYPFAIKAKESSISGKIILLYLRMILNWTNTKNKTTKEEHIVKHVERSYPPLFTLKNFRTQQSACLTGLLRPLHSRSLSYQCNTCTTG